MRLFPLATFVWLCACGFAAADGAEPRVVKNSLGMEFVAIPDGDFLMGSDDGDPMGEADERPRHRVRITRPFRLGVCEVSQHEFATVMGANPSWFAATGGGRDDVAGMDTSRFPVDMITWLEADEFCRRLSALPAEKAAGRRYRLPTEAEWEYAARAGATTKSAGGDRLEPAKANVAFDLATRDPASPRRTWPVDAGTPDALGLRNMHGNVWEWCADRYDPTYYERSPTDDPPGPAEGTGRAVRGGDYRSPPEMARSTNRDFTRESRRDQGNGLRVVLIAE